MSTIARHHYLRMSLPWSCLLPALARRGTALAAPYSSVSKPPPAPALELAGRLVPYRDPILALEAGDFFVHRTLGYRAVVLRTDQGFSENQPGHGANDFSPQDKLQAFYLALPDERDSTRIYNYCAKSSPVQYVPHDEAVAFHSSSPLENTWSSMYFRGFDSGKHQLHTDFFALF